MTVSSRGWVDRNWEGRTATVRGALLYNKDLRYLYLLSEYSKSLPVVQMDGTNQRGWEIRR